MQAAATPRVEQAIQRALVNESVTELFISGGSNDPLTENDARRIILCLQQTPRVDTLEIYYYSLHDDAVLDIFRDGLPMCTSITTVSLVYTQLTNEDLDRLRPAFYNTSITKLDIRNNHIEGRRGGEVLRDLLVGNDTLRELYLWRNCRFGPEGAISGRYGQYDRLTKSGWYIYTNDHLTVNDAQCIIECLRQTPRVDTLTIGNYSPHDDAMLSVLRDGLPLCTSITTVKLYYTQLTNEDLDRLRPAFYNTSVKSLHLYGEDIQGRRLQFYINNNILGQRGGEVMRDLLVGNDTLRELVWCYNRIGPEVAIGIGQGLTDNHCGLQNLYLKQCHIGNDGLANLLLAADGKINNSLMELDLTRNGIQGADGGRQVSLLLQCFTALKVLNLNSNCIGPHGARALAPGLAAAVHLEVLQFQDCGLGNNGVAKLIPDGQVNRSLTHLDLSGNNIGPLKGGASVMKLASRCTNLDRLDVNENILNPNQRRRLNLLLVPNRLCTEASALGGSPFSVLFRFVEKAHCHKHGLSAIFVILQNDGDDYFCVALNRAME